MANSRLDSAIDQALPAYLLLKPEGADESEIKAALSAWPVEGDSVHFALDRLMSTPAIQLLMDEKSPTGYPQEVSAKEAAKILGCSKDTVLKFKEAGLLKYRNLAPPTSSRPVYRFCRVSVEMLRTGYQADTPTPPMPTQPRRRRVRQRPSQFKHLRLD